MSSLDTGELLKTVALETYGPVRTFQLSGDGHILVTGHDNGSVVVRTGGAEWGGRSSCLGTDISWSPDTITAVWW